MLQETITEYILMFKYVNGNSKKWHFLRRFSTLEDLKKEIKRRRDDPNSYPKDYKFFEKITQITEIEEPK